MNKLNLLFISYLIIGFITSGVFPQSLLNTSIVLPMFFLLPIGVGSWLIPASLTKTFGKLQVTIASYFIGIIILVTFFVARERLTITIGSFEIWSWNFILISVFGIIRLNWFSSISVTVHKFSAVLLASAIVLLPFYLIRFVLFSKYPYTDLFQYSHLLKGAEELANFDRLNPFTADSYIPIWQTTFAILKKLFNINLLDSFWVLPWIALPFRVACYYLLATKLYLSQHNRIFFALALLITLGTMPPSNGDIAMLGSIFILAVFLNQSQQQSLILKNSVFNFFIVVLSVLSSFTLATNTIWGVPILLISTSILLLILPERLNRYQNIIFISQITIALAPVHRGVLMFLPLVALLAMWRSFSIRYPRFGLYISFVSGPLLFLFVGIIIVIKYFFPLSTNKWYWLGSLLEMLSPVFAIQNKDVAMGAGSKVALFELARSIGLWLPLCAGLGIYLLLKNYKKLFIERIHLNRYNTILIGGWPISASAILAILILLGVPFVHRAAFLIVIPLTMISVSSIDTKYEYNLWIRGIIFYVLTIVSFIFAVQHASDIKLFTNLIQPYAITTAILIIFFSIFIHLFKKKKRVFLAILLLGTLLLDRVLFNIYFLNYNYINMQASAESIHFSHYNKTDIDIAQLLQNQKIDTILVSDTITLANLRAFTGLNSIVTFSNLDTMPKQTLEHLKKLLLSVFISNADKNENRCYIEADFKNFLNISGYSAETNYALYQRSSRNVTGTDILSAFNYKGGLLTKGKGKSKSQLTNTKPNHQWINDMVIYNQDLNSTLFTVIITPRTYQWLKEGTLNAYSESNEKIPNSIIAHLQQQCGAINFADAIIIPVHKK